MISQSVTHVANSIACHFGNQIALHPGVPIATIIALLAHKILSSIIQPHKVLVRSCIQLTSAGLGIAATTNMLGLTIAPNALLIAVVAPIIIHAIANLLCVNAPNPDAAQVEHARLQRLLDDKTVATNLLADQNEALAKQHEALQQRLANLAQPQANPADGDEQAANLRQQLTSLKTEHAQNLATLQDQLNAAHAQKQSLGARIASSDRAVQDAVQDKEAQAAKDAGTIADLKNQVANLRNELSQAQADAQKLQDKLTQTAQPTASQDALTQNLQQQQDAMAGALPGVPEPRAQAPAAAAASLPLPNPEEEVEVITASASGNSTDDDGMPWTKVVGSSNKHATRQTGSTPSSKPRQNKPDNKSQQAPGQSSRRKNNQQNKRQ